MVAQAVRIFRPGRLKYQLQPYQAWHPAQPAGRVRPTGSSGPRARRSAQRVQTRRRHPLSLLPLSSSPIFERVQRPRRRVFIPTTSPTLTRLPPASAPWHCGALLLSSLPVLVFSRHNSAQRPSSTAAASIDRDCFLLDDDHPSTLLSRFSHPCSPPFASASVSSHRRSSESALTDECCYLQTSRLRR